MRAFFAAMPAECSKCRTLIRGETGIQCDGVSNKVYHCTTKCSGLDQYSVGSLESKNYVRFICDDYIQYIHNVDLVLKDIEDGVGKNKQQLVDYKHEFNAVLKENENRIRKLLEAIEKRYEKRLKKIGCSKTVREKFTRSLKVIWIF